MAKRPEGAARSRRKTYRVKDVWKTLQGEGFFSGRPAVFVRLVGCNMWSGYEADRERDARRHGAGCPRWCDTNFRKEESTAYEARQLAQEIKAVGGAVRFCVLTGGEPFLQANAPLIRALHEAGFQVAAETNGTIPLDAAFRDDETGALHPPDWIVCSPKLSEEEIQVEYCHELKLVVPDYHPEDYQGLVRRVRRQNLGGQQRRLLWLQPEDGPRFDQARQMAIELALTDPAWRVSTQMHKVLGVK